MDDMNTFKLAPKPLFLSNFRRDSLHTYNQTKLSSGSNVELNANNYNLAECERGAPPDACTSNAEKQSKCDFALVMSEAVKTSLVYTGQTHSFADELDGNPSSLMTTRGHGSEGMERCPRVDMGTQCARPKPAQHHAYSQAYSYHWAPLLLPLIFILLGTGKIFLYYCLQCLAILIIVNDFVLFLEIFNNLDHKVYLMHKVRL
jgi:hypothetical protein